MFASSSKKKPSRVSEDISSSNRASDKLSNKMTEEEQMKELVSQISFPSIYD